MARRAPVLERVLHALGWRAGTATAARQRPYWRALAQTWGTGSLSQGLRFPLTHAYHLSIPRIAAEAGGVGAAAGGAGYGIHEATK